MARTNNMIWGVVLVLAGFAIAVVGLRFTYPTSLIIDLVGPVSYTHLTLPTIYSV